MTPVQIEVILKFWYLPYPDQERWSPVQKDFIRQLIRSGHLVHRDGVTDVNRAAVEPVIEALCAVPLSQMTWSLPAPDSHSGQTPEV